MVTLESTSIASSAELSAVHGSLEGTGHVASCVGHIGMLVRWMGRNLIIKEIMRKHEISIMCRTGFGQGDSSTSVHAICSYCGAQSKVLWDRGFPATYDTIRKAQAEMDAIPCEIVDLPHDSELIKIEI